MFHRFCGPQDLGRSSDVVCPDELEEIILFVGPDRILPPREWMRRLDRRELRPRDICVTFDDGLRSQVEWALPVLERFGIQAFWFVYSCVFEGIPVKSEIYSDAASRLGGIAALAEEFLRQCPAGLLARLDSAEFASYSARIQIVAPFYTAHDIQFRFLRNLPDSKAVFEDVMDAILAGHGVDVGEVAHSLWLTSADLVELTVRDHYIGLHSYDHPYDMASLSRHEQERQYGRNFAHLEAAIGQKPVCVSHPLDSYNHDSLAILNGLGIRCGFRANSMESPGRGINPSSLELAREDSANLLSMRKGDETRQSQAS